MAAPTRTDWLMMLGVAVIGGSSFAAIEVAVETAPPAVIAAARLWTGCAVMAAHTAWSGRPFLPFRPRRAWAYAAAAGLLGYAAPMTMIPLAQETVSSILASVYQAFMPVLTVLLAAAFADEALTRRKLGGFALGTAGVLALIGPTALSGVVTASLWAQALLLLAILGYASAGVVMRRAPDVPERGFATAFLFAGALLATPGAVLSGADGVSAASWAAIAYLGVFPTGITAVFIILVVRRVGAGFLAMSAYGAPLVALLLGTAFLGERVGPREAAGLCLILGGVAVAQPGSLAALRAAGSFRAGRSRPAR